MRTIEQMEKKLVTSFEMIHIGPISFYFGPKIKGDCEKRILELSQLVYIDKILAKYHLN